ncbi:MAG: inosine-5-monophosphate dehydrogenase [Kordiimonas sp.]|nr:inosine-5-monophosphate dehydrogenase [Kordiimonas sp.]
MFVSNILQRKGHDVISIKPGVTIQEAARVLRENKIGAIIVCKEDGKMCGVLSERDIIIALAKKGAAVLDHMVSEYMTEGVYTCGPDDDMSSVMSLMTSRRIRHVPVVQDEKVIGIISIGDAVKQRIAETEAEAEALKQYITTG